MIRKIDASAEDLDGEYLLNASRALEILDHNDRISLDVAEVDFRKGAIGCLDTHFSVTTFTGRKVETFFQSGIGYKPSGEQMARLILEKIGDELHAAG